MMARMKWSVVQFYFIYLTNIFMKPIASARRPPKWYFAETEIIL